MSSDPAYTLPPINAGDVFTCQGKGLLYEEIPRSSVEDLRHLLGGGSGQTLAGNRKEPKKWFQAQCAHYGLPTKGVVANLRGQLETFVASPTARVPESLANLETEKNHEYEGLNERIKKITSRARSPTPGRTRRVTITDSPAPKRISQRTPPSGTETPRSRATSLTVPSRARTKSAEPEPKSPVPPKRGRGRPRKSEPVPSAERTGGQAKEVGLASSNSKRPQPPSQTDSVISAYSSLDDEVMDALDDIEHGIDLLETDADGDSQMNPLQPDSNSSSPPPARASSALPQTPRRHKDNAAITPKGSPKFSIERDVVSGMWSLRIISHILPKLKSPHSGQPVNSKTNGSGTMNLHLAEDKRSLAGEFNLLGIDGVVHSRTLEGRADGAYTRLMFVGQMTVEKKTGETTNRVLGPAPTQSGYLRFNDGRKATDGRLTLKGALQADGYGKVDFEGVREGDEQEMCANWDDFVD